VARQDPLCLVGARASDRANGIGNQPVAGEESCPPRCRLPPSRSERSACSIGTADPIRFTLIERQGCGR